MEKLRAYLHDAGVTQRSFAERVGLSRSHLNEIISGRKRPSLDLAFSIARATSGAVPVDAWDASVDGTSQDPSSNTNPEVSHHDQSSDCTDAA